jgi:hypothetical protein
LLFDTLRGLAQGIALHVCQGHVHASGRAALGQRAADSGRGAGDDGGLAQQLLHG